MLLALSGHAPICTRFPSQDHYEDAGATTRLMPPPPPVSVHSPVLVAQPLPQSSHRAACFGGAIYDIPADVLRGAILPTVPSDAEHRILTPDTTTSTMTGMGISVDNLPSFPRPDCEPAN